MGLLNEATVVFEVHLSEVVDIGGSPPEISVGLASLCLFSDPTEIAEGSMIPENLATYVSLSPGAMVSLLVSTFRRVLLDSNSATSFSFRFRGWRELSRSRGVDIGLTDGVSRVVGFRDKGDRDRLNVARSTKAVGRWKVGVVGLGVGRRS